MAHGLRGVSGGLYPRGRGRGTDTGAIKGSDPGPRSGRLGAADRSGADRWGGYFRIDGGPAADRLLAVSADIAQSVELHTMRMDGDVMRMRQLDSVDVPAKQSVEFKPGGMHVMLIGLKTPLKVGNSFPMTLRFEKAGSVSVNVRVLPAPPAAEHKH